MKKILLVNNDQAFLDRNKSLLTRSGFEILTARSAEEALQVHRSEMASVLVASLNLPDMGADDLCLRLREDERLKHVSVIIVSFPTPQALHRASHCGANAVLTKPVQPQLLLDQVSRFTSIATRRHHRVRLNGRINGTKGTESFSGFSENISVSGILCEIDIRLRHDDLVTITCPIDSHRIVADGKVVRCVASPEGGYNYGLQFVRMTQECREGIEQFVADGQRELERACG